jgi:hypothetical protein
MMLKGTWYCKNKHHFIGRMEGSWNGLWNVFCLSRIFIQLWRFERTCSGAAAAFRLSAHLDLLCLLVLESLFFNHSPAPIITDAYLCLLCQRNFLPN